MNNVYHGDRMNEKGDTLRNIASKGITIIAADMQMTPPLWQKVKRN